VESERVSQEDSSALKSVLASLSRKVKDDSETERLCNCYLSLISACLTGTIYEDHPMKVSGSGVYDRAIRLSEGDLLAVESNRRGPMP
jgi:hypothetical protein